MNTDQARRLDSLRQLVCENDTKTILFLCHAQSITTTDLSYVYEHAARLGTTEMMAVVKTCWRAYHRESVDARTLSVVFDIGMAKGDLAVCLVALAHGFEPDVRTLKDCVAAPAMSDAEKLQLYEQITARFKNSPYVRACQYALAGAMQTRNLPLFEHVSRICGSATRREQLFRHRVDHPVDQPYTDALIRTTAHRHFQVTLDSTVYAHHTRIKMRMRAVDAATAMIQLGRRRSRVAGNNGRDVLRLIGKCVLATWTDGEAWGGDDGDDDDKKQKV